jgi:hypothetical protein
VSGDRRELESFARTVEALGPYLDRLVFVGGWAHFLYTLRPEAAPLRFSPLTTKDADVAAPLDLPSRGSTIAQRLIDAGFRQEFSGDHIPPVSSYALGDGADGYYVEFLAPLIGGERKRDGRLDATVKVGGVSAQKLRHLDVLLLSPWQVTISPEHGFPVGKPTAIRIPNPAAYLVQKVLVLRSRAPGKQAKDVLYLHDTLAIFADALHVLGAAWTALRPQLDPAHVRTFEERAAGLISTMSDLIRDAARIAADRPQPPSPEELLAGLRRGFAEVFDQRPVNR